MACPARTLSLQTGRGTGDAWMFTHLCSLRHSDANRNSPSPGTSLRVPRVMLAYSGRIALALAALIGLACSLPAQEVIWRASKPSVEPAVRLGTLEPSSFDSRAPGETPAQDKE